MNLLHLDPTGPDGGCCCGNPSGGHCYERYKRDLKQIEDQAGLALSLGIAIQNFPEGAIISMSLRAEGMRKARSFAGGILSGVVELMEALLTTLAAGLVVPALPYLLRRWRHALCGKCLRFFIFSS